MRNEIVNWWRVLWTEQKPVATAIAGFVAAFAMFLIKDAIWQRRVSRIDKRYELKQRQLENLYSPLYRFYRESYSRFDSWRANNPDTTLERQPFFQPEGESFVERLIAQHSAYASTELIRLWADLNATDDKPEKLKRRKVFVETMIREYQELRKSLKLDYDRDELARGQFKI